VLRNDNEVFEEFAKGNISKEDITQMREGFVDFSKVKLNKVKVEKIYDEEEVERKSAVIRSETKSLAELTNVFEGGFRKKTTKVKRTVLEEGNMNEINEGLKGQNFTK